MEASVTTPTYHEAESLIKDNSTNVPLLNHAEIRIDYEFVAEKVETTRFKFA